MAALVHGKTPGEAKAGVTVSASDRDSTRGALPPFPFVKTCLACHANKVFEMNRVKSMWRGRAGGEGGVSLTRARGEVVEGLGVMMASPQPARAEGASSQPRAERLPACKGRSLHAGCRGWHFTRVHKLAGEGADPPSPPRAEQGLTGSFRQRHMAVCRRLRSPSVCLACVYNSQRPFFFFFVKSAALLSPRSSRCL